MDFWPPEPSLIICTRNTEHTDDAAIEGRILYVSPKVSGYVTSVAIEDNLHVKAGDTLLQIDPRDYEIAVRQAEANLAAVTSGLSASTEAFESSKVTAPSDIAAKAMVARAEAEYTRASSDYNRKSKMGDLVISKQGLIDARSAMQSALSNGLFIAHTFFIWAMYFFMTYFCFFALDSTSHLGLKAGMFVLVIGGLGMSAPVQGGIGAYHWIVSQGLLLFNIDLTDGIVFATLVHTSQTILVIILGLLSLFMLFLTGKKPVGHEKK